MTESWSMPVGSLDGWADDYERGRPGWPRAVLDVPGLAPRATVLDLGAGTGKLTRLLVARFARVVAIEPAEAMRRVLVSQCPRATALEGTAEEIPLPDASVDAVFAAESFHKFDGERAVAEIARVLRPRGPLVLMWNLPAGRPEPSIEDVEQFLDERAPLRAELAYDPLDLSPDRLATGTWRVAFANTAFEEFEELRLPNPQTTDRDGLVAFFASMGWIGDLPDAERLALLAGLTSLLEPAQYVRPWETHVYRTRRV